MIFGKPIFIWFGIGTAICVVLMITIGLFGKRKTHMKFAWITILFMALHILGVLRVY